MRVSICLIFMLVIFYRARAQDTRLLLSGRVYEADSVTPIAFAYILNNKSGGGTVSDAQGRFSLYVDKKDTVYVSCIGRQAQHMAISSLLNRVSGTVIHLDIYMLMLPVKLRSALVIALKPSPSRISDAQFYQGIIKDYTIKRSHRDTAVNAMPSRSYYGVLSGLLMPLTRKGKEIKKFRSIYMESETKKVVNKRFNEDLVHDLTGLPYTRVDAFKKHCNFSNEFVLSSSDYDFLRAIREAFARFKSLEKDTLGR